MTSRCMRRLLAALALVAAPLLQGAGWTAEAAGIEAEVGEVTSVPYGWVDFCNRYAGECDGPALPPLMVVLNPRALREIDRVNRSVNAGVTPVTDMDHWGVVDRWDYPVDHKGDCEDYALLKRQILMKAGYPRQALLMTVVKDAQGDGHAILTVKTDRGEFVLDNMVDAILAWNQSGYRFVKRQSEEDPNVWRTIGPATSAPLYTSNP